MDLQNISFFEGIDAKVIEEIKTVCNKNNYESGELIFKKGTSADFLYVLEQGEIDLLLKEEDQTIFSLTEPGEVFGWSSIVFNGIYTATCTCKIPTTVLKISKQDIEAIFYRHPVDAIKFYRRLGSIFSRRISKALE